MEPERIPELIGGRWQVERLLGEGEMGRVYQAHHSVHGTRVAVKLIDVPSGDSALRKRALQSATALSVLASSHTVRLLDVGQEDDVVFLVHEFVDGRSLGELIPVSLGHALLVAWGVTDALVDAHRNGFIHRDIKPDNVLIPRRPDGSMDFSASKLLDFGVAGILEIDRSGLSRTSAGQFFGTPLYMSPEQARGEPQTIATDIYGVGALLYTMLFGRPPFQADNITTLLMAILSEEPSFPSSPAISPTVIRFIGSCLAKDPKARPLSAEGVRHSLEILLGVVYGPPGPPFQVAAQFPAPQRSASAELPSPVAAAPSSTPLPAVPTRGGLSRTQASGIGRERSAASPGSFRVAGIAGGILAVAAVAAVAIVLAFVPVPPMLAAGLGGAAALAVSWGLALLVHRSIERRRPPLGSAIGTLLGRANSSVDLSKSLAIDISQLVETCRRVDQRFLAKTIALMLTEYDKASASSDRQTALMKAVELMEKLQSRLAPWYVRHQTLISWGIGIAGTVAAAAKTVRELLAVAKH